VRARANHPVMGPTRLEAFSDGVFAIAATLLVLDLHVPATSGSDLAHALGAQWPSYAAYAISFVTIGIVWINHHAMISRLRSVDHGIMALNLGLLVTIGLLPFTSALMAAYLRQGQGDHLAAAVYSGSYLLMSVLFAATNRHILLVKSHLLQRQMPERQRRAILTRSILGLVPYVFATALAAVSAYATLVICAAIACYYALPAASVARE
jgi:uncharacterized membrane protein